ncbi:MerR family transcriptional regulator [Actinokineospora diospyrosa]|uniref:MerR HTH family regulatory protein n=1 Tax=Actinokineospora diospyrosa TaxID=103728 RepID=A0ABT1IJM3_9PSEU|nr:MerR family transcriptional regulator [Actinokineospora diospyrosa]MCP2272852.1 MerR HTH family regulatory protein [Actinokineospora diospyrosa]
MGRDTALTVEQLAAEAGLPTSTIRMYQTKGLLHAPRRQGRTARYDSTHVERLGLVHRLQQRGFSLPAIAELIAARDLGARVGDVLGLDGAGGPDDWVPLRVGELLSTVPARQLKPTLVARATRVGILRWRRGWPHTRRWAAEAGLRLTRLRVPQTEMLDTFDRVHAASTAIAADFTALFEKHLWPTLAADAVEEDQLGQVRALLLELTETAQSVVAGALRDAIRAAAENFAAQQGLLPDHGEAPWAEHTPPVLAQPHDEPDDPAPSEAEIQCFLDGVSEPGPTEHTESTKHCEFTEHSEHSGRPGVPGADQGGAAG